MKTIPTVAIRTKEGERLVINESDFDPHTHQLWIEEVQDETKRENPNKPTNTKKDETGQSEQDQAKKTEKDKTKDEDSQKTAQYKTTGPKRN